MDMMVDPTLQTTVPADVDGIKFWPRAGAYFIDFLLLYGFTYVSSHSCVFVLRQLILIVLPIIGKSHSYLLPIPTIGNYIVAIIQTITYFALFEWLYGRTFGKLAWGLRVISTNGDSCTLKQAFSRSVYRIVDGLFFGIVAANYMKPPTYQRLGDQKASTLVVSSKNAYINQNPKWWRFIIALLVYLLADAIILAVWYSAFIRFK